MGKWIGQHIYDLVARFRNDVYLEGISTSTETDMLVVDSNNKVSKRAASGLTVGTATLASTVEVTDSTVDANQPVVFNNEVGGLRDDTGAFTYNPSTGTLTTPNLTVSGTTTTINTTNLNVEDKNITLNYNASSDTSSTAEGAGITIQDAVDASNDALFSWDAGDNKWKTSHSLSVLNGSSGGVPALIVNNQDVDQIALDINASNTTANILDVNAQSLTTGNAIFIDSNSLTTGSAISLDVDDALTTPTTARSLISIDYDKSGATENLIGSTTTGLKIDMDDSATNNGGAIVQMVGAQIDINSANTTSTNKHGLVLNVADDGVGNAANTKGIIMTVMDGGDDMVFKSSAVDGDDCTWQTGTNGATTITTHDSDNSNHLAHFKVQADGNITLDPSSAAGSTVGTIALEANTTVTGDVVTTGNIELGHASDTTIARVASGIASIEGANISTHSLTLKILPSAFQINDDVGRPVFVEDDTSNTLGVRCFSTTDEMYAWKEIPAGFKVTHVQVHASSSVIDAVSVRSYNYQTGADNNVTSTTATFNQNTAITNIPASSTQDLVIKCAPASDSVIIFGASITIATI